MSSNNEIVVNQEDITDVDRLNAMLNGTDPEYQAKARIQEEQRINALYAEIIKLSMDVVRLVNEGRLVLEVAKVFEEKLYIPATNSNGKTTRYLVHSSKGFGFADKFGDEPRIREEQIAGGWLKINELPNIKERLEALIAKSTQ